MVNQVTLYKQLLKWIAPPFHHQEMYQHLFFFKDGVAATNTHQAIFVPQVNLNSHMETTKGELWNPGTGIIPQIDKNNGCNTLEEYLDEIIRHKFDKIRPNKDDILWSGSISSDCFAEWKSTLALIQRLSRKKTRSGTETTMILAKEGSNLVAYVSKNQYCQAKFYLYTALNTPTDEPDIQWHGAFKVDYFCNVVDFAMEIGAPSITWSITTDEYPLMMAEFQGIWSVCTYTRCFEEWGLDQFYEWANIPICSPIMEESKDGSSS